VSSSDISDQLVDERRDRRPDLDVAAHEEVATVVDAHQLRRGDAARRLSAANRYGARGSSRALMTSVGTVTAAPRRLFGPWGGCSFSFG
jgi:hypothetical protein